MKNLVIGIDGLSGVGKTSTAKLLCEKNNNYIYAELGDLCRKILPLWVELKQKYNEEYAIKVIEQLEINYTIKNYNVKFEIIGNNIKANNLRLYNRRELYNMIQIEKIKVKIYNYLVGIINELRKKYTVIFVGRELELIYKQMDYHFCLKSNENDRIERIMKRDMISEKEAKERRIEQKIHNFSKKVITINTSRMEIENVVLLIQNVLTYKNRVEEKIKVQFMGAQSTGKTTISKLCAEKFNEPYVGEELRYCMEYDKLGFSDILIWSYKQWYDIINLQLQSEIKMKNNAKRFVFADSAALLYAIDFDLMKNVELKKIINKQIDSAGIIFVCDNEFPYEEDKIRPSKSQSNIELCQEKIINYLENKNKLYIVLSGTVEERLNTVEQILNRNIY